MRQIDNMTSQEIDTLALKGMTAPKRTIPADKPKHLQPTGKPVSVSQFQRDYDAHQRTIPAEKPTAIKTSQELLDSKCNRILSPYEQAQYDRAVRAEAHAAQLAEALRDITGAVEQGRWIAFESCVAWSQKALAAYESEGE